eukprot:1151391-Pelagomonas_calceolata.AAC.1
MQVPLHAAPPQARELLDPRGKGPGLPGMLSTAAGAASGGGAAGRCCRCSGSGQAQVKALSLLANRSEAHLLGEHFPPPAQFLAPRSSCT